MDNQYDDMIWDTGDNFYNNAEQKAMRAFELYEDGEVSQALLELNEAIDINPANSAWHFNRGLALDSMNRFEEAVKAYEAALELNPADPEVFNSLAVDYTRTGHYDLALTTFEQAQQLDPMFESCYCNRIITYTEMDMHDKAEEMFYLAQQIDHDCALCFYNIGNSLFIRGDYKKAIGCWLKTAELEPTHPQINYRIAQCHWAEGDIENAKKYFLAELRKNPGDIDVIGDFGLLLLETGDVDSANEKFNRILEFEPESAMARFYIGEIAYNQGLYGKAELNFIRAMQADNKLPGPRFRLAQCALKKKQQEKATGYLAAELNLNPDDPDVMVAMASMFLQVDELDRAGQCLLRATDLDFGHASAHYYLGICCALRERYDDAAELFLHTLDIDENRLDAMIALAKIYIALGRYDDAADTIETAKNMTDDHQQLKPLTSLIRKNRITEKLNRIVKRRKPIHA